MLHIVQTLPQSAEDCLVDRLYLVIDLGVKRGGEVVPYAYELAKYVNHSGIELHSVVQYKGVWDATATNDVFLQKPSYIMSIAIVSCY